MQHNHPPVSLFIPCLVDQVYPEIGIAMLEVLRRFRFKVKFDAGQTCCGQPAFNAGHHDEARLVARNFLKIFAEDKLIVSPSGSCTAAVRQYYRQLFENDKKSGGVERVASSVFEFSEFLVEHADLSQINSAFSGKIGFHNSCHSLRELRITEAPLQILRRFTNEIFMPAGNPVCCGFGGLFSFKFASIAGAMSESRLDHFVREKVEVLVSNDPGCLMHLRQEAAQKAPDLRILHLAEFLWENMKN